MAHITLSIPDETHKIMKEHPEINWSELARRNIIAQAVELRREVPVGELLKTLPESTRKSILESDDASSAEFARKVRKKGWKRTRYLTQA
jgi:hypothetical protein